MAKYIYITNKIRNLCVYPELQHHLFSLFRSAQSIQPPCLFCNCPANMVVFILLTPPWTARRRPRCPPPPPSQQTHTMLRVRARSAVCGLQCRAEVMGSSRKVRSRVHGGVMETWPWLLFAFFLSLSLHNSASFLQEDVSSVPPSSPRNNPVTAQTLFVFLRLLNLPPAGKRPVSPRHYGRWWV